MIVPLSTQIMVNSHYGKRLKLFQFYLIIISAIFIKYHECRRDYTNCCEVLKIISSSFLAKFHPEHLGSYKLIKNSKYVYKSLTEPNSYIYLLSLGKGNSDVFKFRYCNFELWKGKFLYHTLLLLLFLCFYFYSNWNNVHALFCGTISFSFKYSTFTVLPI